MKQLEIIVQPGTVVNLGGRRSSSRKGGAYTATIEGEAHEWRLRHNAGVTILDGSEMPELTKHNLTLADTRSMSDEQLLELNGIGEATLRRIRNATEGEG